MTGSAKQSMPLRHCERSEAIHAARKNGLLRRGACHRARRRRDPLAPLRKRFAFVAGNDEEARASRHRLREARSKGLDCFVAALLAMTVTGSARFFVIACDKREAFAQGSQRVSP